MKPCLAKRNVAKLGSFKLVSLDSLIDMIVSKQTIYFRRYFGPKLAAPVSEAQE